MDTGSDSKNENDGDAENAEQTYPGESEENAAEKKTSEVVITKLDSWSVHRICSGQVIISLAVAVKELVENALDAGAKEIIVRTREFGSKSIEIQDNGEGILPQNFESLCLKHFTSKLREFSDLESIATFGFRGEALSSLCALGQVSVVTKHSTKAVGSSLRYDAEGRLVENKPCARETGTTVYVENIFAPLPVRHKQFITTLKKEFTKMVHFMSGYGLIARGVSMAVVNFDDRARRHEVLRKRAHLSYRDNIAEVFGYKEVSKLLAYEPAPLPLDADVLEEFRLTKLTSEYFDEVVIEGFVSSCVHGQGRSTGDRQFFFVNSRPCEHAKLTKLVNQVYHQYNSLQQPFVMLNVLTPQQLVDVNLTPDKRTILLHRENVMLAMIKASLVAMFNKQATQYAVNTVDATYLEKSFFQDRSAESRNSSVLETSMTNSLDGDSDASASVSGMKDAKTGKFLSKFTRTGGEKQDGAVTRQRLADKSDRSGAFASGVASQRSASLKERFAFQSSSSKRKIQESQVSSPPSRPKRSTGETGGVPLSSYGFTRSLGKIHDESGSGALQERSWRLEKFLKGAKKSDEVENAEESSGERNKLNEAEKEYPPDADLTDEDIGTTAESAEEEGLGSKRRYAVYKSNVEASTDTLSDKNQLEGDSLAANEEPDTGKCAANENEPVGSDSTEDDMEGHHSDDSRSNGSDKLFDTFVDDVVIRQVGICRLDWTLDNLTGDFQAILQEDTGTAERSLARSDCRFRARISPNENTSAESELTREISKEMFEQMEIIGQFNKGFIIARLDNDLFIVDQHAADEKFNFETLQATTTIDCQPLAIPQKLSVAPGNEQTILEHLAIFEKNGFRIAVDEDAPWGQRLALAAVPQSGQWQMGMTEVDELIFMLNDNSHPNLVNCRPAKVRSMFAMRACRRSVMVGDELNKREMTRVVSQLSRLQHPWNCPHGRPTMRHLVNLSFVKV